MYRGTSQGTGCFLPGSTSHLGLESGLELSRLILNHRASLTALPPEEPTLPWPKNVEVSPSVLVINGLPYPRTPDLVSEIQACTLYASIRSLSPLTTPPQVVSCLLVPPVYLVTQDGALLPAFLSSSRHKKPLSAMPEPHLPESLLTAVARISLHPVGQKNPISCA